MTDRKQFTADIVARAIEAGASAADAIYRESDEFSTLVRLGEVEQLKESGSRGVGLRVFLGKRSASTYTSDLSAEGVEQMIRGAVALAAVTSEDPMAGLPEQSELGSLPGDLGLYYDDVFSLPAAERIEHARRAEKAAMSADPRITNSEGGGFDASTGRTVLANSLGFCGEYRGSRCSISAVPIATQNGAMQRDWWFTMARSVKKLDSPESIGRTAAARALRRLGARKVKTAQVPIVFEPMIARTILEHIFEAANGDAVYRGASFLKGKLGEQVAGSNVTVVDDGTMPGGYGTSPFDGEGVPSRRTVVIEKGVLRSYLLNSYTARKLGLKTTGNAARGMAGNPGISSGNFFLEPGEKTPQQIIAGVKEGLYVTDMLGFGGNLVSGEYSRGASGLWIHNGELTFPVEEVTVGGNLKEMFRNIAEIGNDLEFRGSVASPTLRIEGLTVAGS